MARVLIVGGDRRARWLAGRLGKDGHAARVVARTEASREAIEQAGGECWIGDPDRLATLTGSLDGVTIVCWLMGCVEGTPDQLEALHGSRLRSFMGKAIDSSVRGFLYEAAGTVQAELLRGGREIAREVASMNRIPLATIDADPKDAAAWQLAVTQAIESFLTPAPTSAASG